MPIVSNSTQPFDKTVKLDSNNKKMSAEHESFIPVYPKYSFEDIILNTEAINEIFDVLSFREKSDLVFREWGLSKTHKSQKKVAINFYGKPGTGKTMAAHAVASYYNKKIIEVNYADIESKYVGDTPKNLTKVFQQAKVTGSVLFFDEADAILSRRVTNMNSSTDTSVNQTRSVLLMLLNDFDGIVVFATNFLSNFDPAFMRRILGHVEFKLPDLATRKKLWRHLIPEELPNTLDINDISESFSNVSGSDISNAIMKSAFKAARNDESSVPHNYFEQSIKSIKRSMDDNQDINIKKRKISKEYAEKQLTKEGEKV